MRRVGWCLVLLFLTGAAAAQPDAAQIVARVNDTPITVDRFNTSYVRHLIQTGANDTPEQRYAHLERLIDAYLLAEEARRRGMEDAAHALFAERQVKKAVGERFFERTFLDSLPDLTEAEVRQAFRHSRDKIVARHLFYREEEAAEAAYRRLEAGEDFLALANECFGTAAFDSSAGYLGLAGYWELDDAFAEAAFALPVGGHSRPVRSRYGWHVIRVEDRIYNPLLTESEYQYRRKGVLAQARQRRFRLEGDRFVRRFMEDLGVTVVPENLEALHEGVRRAMGSSDEPETPPRVLLDADEVRSIRAELRPETVLATYTLRGETRAFTALDYYKWLEDLPYGEVRHRTAASVGRALRNEVLAIEGLTLGLEQEASVQEEVRYQVDLYLADRLRTHLRTTESVEPTDAEMRQAYERLGFRKLEAAVADFWQIRFGTLAEAEAARDGLAADSLRAGAFDTYAHFEGRDLGPLGELGYHLRRAPLRMPVVVGTGDGAWYLVEVQDRTFTYTAFEDVQDEIRRVLSSSLPEVRLLQTLRRQARVDVDRDLFERMMKLDASV